jgi:hypothetical protein
MGFKARNTIEDGGTFLMRLLRAIIVVCHILGGPTLVTMLFDGILLLAHTSVES